MNAIKLQLNLEALNALFPEGSEARLDLQRNVVANMLERIALKDVKHLADGLEEQAKRAAKETLEGIGVCSNWSGNIVLADRVKGAIRSQVVDQVQSQIRNDISAAAEAARQDIDERVNAAVERVIDSKIKGGLKDLIRELVRDTLKGI